MEGTGESQPASLPRPAPTTSVFSAGTPIPPEPIPPTPGVRRLWPVLVVLVALGMILALVAAGVFNSIGPSAATPTYSRAVGPANQSAAQVPGGPWDLVAAVAFDTPIGTTVPVGASVGTNCTLVPSGPTPTPTSLFIPAFRGSFGSGESPWWGMIYDQRSTHQILLVQVLNGSAQALAVGSGPCSTSFQNFTTVPSTAVDSSVAASAAWSQGGSAFAAAHSSLSLSLEMGLIGGGTFGGLPVGAVWVIQVTPCGAFGSKGPNGTQPDFEALVDAETGSVTFSTATSTVCGASGGPVSTPLGTVFSPGPPVLLSPSNATAGCRIGDYCYRIPIEAIAGLLTPANLSFSVNNPTGALVSGVQGFAILTLAGQVLVSSVGNPASPLWTSGTGNSMSALLAGMTIVADVGSLSPVGMNYVLETAGVGSFSGTVTESLP